MSVKKKVIFSLILLFFFNASQGQETPYNPVSYRIFTPFLFNPAIAGSKDFFSADLLAGWSGKNRSQLLSSNTRYAKLAPEYISSYIPPEFTNIGFGAAIYNDLTDYLHTSGITITGSYHFPLDKKKLSYISAGISGKGIYTKFPDDSDSGSPSGNRLVADMDLGVYFYSPSFYTGISSVNILGNHEIRDSIGTYRIPVSRRFFFLAGYKVLVSKSLNIVVEPSVIVSADDSLSGEVKDMIDPLLKVYAGNFCLGTYFRDYSKISFFFQYRYPRFYVGTYFDMPKNTPFFKKSLIAEFTLGINLSGNKTSSFNKYHW
jgi:type IX secretion system PorP/SprF family membrane protein